jgi:hypothetical protein
MDKKYKKEENFNSYLKKIKIIVILFAKFKNIKSSLIIYSKNNYQLPIKDN